MNGAYPYGQTMSTRATRASRRISPDPMSDNAGSTASEEGGNHSAKYVFSLTITVTWTNVHLQGICYSQGDLQAHDASNFCC
jgi:hypothetical protein